MKRVLILANFDIGLYKFRKDLIEELLNRGNEVFLSLPNGEFVPLLVKMGCIFLDTPVDRRGINPATDLFLFLRYCWLLKKVRPDLVITYTIKPNLYGGLACRIANIPYAINITGLGTAFQKEGLLKHLIVRLYKIVCKRVKVVFFENEENQQNFVKLGIIPLERTCKLNGAGVNLKEYPLCEYPPDDGETRFLFIGRVMKEKGIDELFEAARLLRKDYPHVFFDIVGPFEDDYKDKIDRLVREGVIRYHGFQSDVRLFIKKCHCFVLPSYHEGMANTLLEAGAMGRPLITSDIPGCREAVCSGMSGYLVHIQDVSSLYACLKSFSDLPYARKVEMARLSQSHVAEKFDKKQVVSKTLEALLDFE